MIVKSRWPALIHGAGTSVSGSTTLPAASAWSAPPFGTGVPSIASDTVELVPNPVPATGKPSVCGFACVPAVT